MTTAQSRFGVAIVGAGFGGLGMASALRRAGIEDFILFESADELGGVWRDNTYPGCSCDVPSHLYSLTVQPYRDSCVRYPDQQGILGYLTDVAERQDLRPHLRLSTSIAAAQYCDDVGRWRLVSSTGEHYEAEVVIFAVGQLHRPYVPEFAGVENFRGAVFHSARWDHTVDLVGRRIAVVGTGSSAGQMLPELAKVARRVTVFQRTPAWVLPKPRQRFGPLHRWALSRLPALHAVYRAAIYNAADVVLGPMLWRGWSARPLELAALAHLYWRVRDAGLRAVLRPRYPIGEKRVLVDSRFYSALTRPNVALVTDPIAEVTAEGLLSRSGSLYPVDVIVWATGFRSTEFLVPIEIRGRGGVRLHERWADGAEAYLGLAVPEFPNMFIVAGPNTFASHNSNPAMKESQIRYVVRALQYRARIGAAAIEVSALAMESYRRWLNEAIQRTIWPAGGPSWYRTASGKITNPWPATSRRFDRMTRHDPAEVFMPVPMSKARASTTTAEISEALGMNRTQRRGARTAVVNGSGLEQLISTTDLPPVAPFSRGTSSAWNPTGVTRGSPEQQHHPRDRQRPHGIHIPSTD